MNPDEVRAGTAAALARGGIRAALAYLNGLAGHRFTALYRFDDPVMRSLHFYDRDAPDAEAGDDFPVELTYCVYVRVAGRPFSVADALRDARTAAHPSRGAVRAYCGVALVDDAGRTFGTLCHFDPDPVPGGDDLADAMEAAAPALARIAARRGDPAGG